MRTCPYCGAEYQDDMLQCPADHTSLVPESPAPTADSALAAEANEQQSPVRASYKFAPLSPEQREMDFVTLVSCGTLPAADLVVSRLRAGGISAFIPDEKLMQTIGFNLSTFGYVRVQVSPHDYEAAKELLGDDFGG